MSVKSSSKKKPYHLNKGLIGSYHYGFNIEHAKPVLEKGPIANSLLGEIPTAGKQTVGCGGDPAGFLI